MCQCGTSTILTFTSSDYSTTVSMADVEGEMVNITDGVVGLCCFI